MVQNGAKWCKMVQNLILIPDIFTTLYLAKIKRRRFSEKPVTFGLT